MRLNALTDPSPCAGGVEIVDSGPVHKLAQIFDGLQFIDRAVGRCYSSLERRCHRASKSPHVLARLQHLLQRTEILAAHAQQAWRMQNRRLHH